jgi:hypothetical protein
MDAKRVSFGRKTTAAAKRRDDREEIHNAVSCAGLEQSDISVNKTSKCGEENPVKRIPLASP